MSLQDESFPSDELFEQLNSRVPRTKFSELHQPAAFERHPAPFCDSYTDVADKSGNTCVSDPVGRHEAEDEDEEKIENDVYELRGGRGGRGSMAASCQDVHSAYTKRKYQHVTSKVAKYISDLNDQKKRRSTAGSIQRHSSMPEYLTPKSRARHGGGHFSVDELHQMEEEESPKASKDSSCVDYEMLQNEHEMLRNENEAIREEKERLQSYSDYLQERLDAKQSQFVQLKRNFETLRTELSDKDEKLKRHQRNSLRALNNWPPPVIAKATQTDMIELKSILKSNNLVRPPPSFDLSYNTSEGSIEMALPTGESLVSPLNPGNESEARTTAAPNSSESSQPSSNDSAIDVENHGLRMGLYYVDERRNRFMQIQGVSMDNQGYAWLRPKRISLGSRMLRIFGPCVSCSDNGQGQALNVTYASEQPLLEEGMVSQRIQR
ncbi:protein swallow [Drosophila serrata]|uniref:protein swallow n=1 Tax=Drosophila serrata TaxID=7274 RepID=UPI000A1D2348|nr:protein swallow [Drosophila serrata]KAH8380952.1 hypothetical protein KR200_006221 [Drosophila serrata]